MQSIPLAVLKRDITTNVEDKPELHAIHTACGIETFQLPSLSSPFKNCMQSIPLAVLKQSRPYVPFLTREIACNPYRLRY